MDFLCAFFYSLSGVSRPKFTLRKVEEDLFVVEILAHLQGTSVFAVKCCGITLRDSPFHIHAVNPIWSPTNSFAVVPSQTFCGDVVRVDITCKDQFGYVGLSTLHRQNALALSLLYGR